MDAYFTFTFHFHALEREMATHSSVLAWRIPGTAEPGGLPSIGLHRVGHDWSDLVAAACIKRYYMQSNKFTLPWILCLSFSFVKQKDHHQTLLPGTEQPSEEGKACERTMEILERNPTDSKMFAAAAAAKSLQSCPTLCNPIDGSPPGSAVPGILQARTLEWVVISFSCNYCWYPYKHNAYSTMNLNVWTLYLKKKFKLEFPWGQILRHFRDFHAYFTSNQKHCKNSHCRNSFTPLFPILARFSKTKKMC